MKRIVGPKKYKITWEWKDYISMSFICTLHKNYSGDQIKKNEMVEAYTTYGVLVGKPEGKRPHGRFRRNEDNIKMGL
jgi:hypothetical protein